MLSTPQLPLTSLAVDDAQYLLGSSPMLFAVSIDRIRQDSWNLRSWAGGCLNTGDGATDSFFLVANQLLEQARLVLEEPRPRI